MGRKAAVVVSLALLSVSAACNETAEPGSAGAAPSAPAAPTPISKKHGMVPMKKVRILVGGCGSRCSDPGLAVNRFLEATAEEGGPEAVAAFLDTTRLVLDGRKLGERWAAMWKELRQATRKEDIAREVTALRTWKDGLDPDQVRAALTSGVVPVKVWSQSAEYTFRHPGGTWHIRLEPRGLEWLVVEISREGTRSAGEPPTR